mmetsp:Transcript_81629/g.95201  ORF Transcript_81629/g.95201 Transcript_81629/m.95201 type:complete len:240 (-) Transcript_81629:474-1193(-)
MRILNNLVSKLLVLIFAAKRKTVFNATLANLVGAKPLTKCLKKSWEKLWHIMNIVEELRNGVSVRDANDLPVHLPVIDHPQHTKNLNGSNGTRSQLCHANLNGVQWVIVTLHALLEHAVGALPCLREGAIVPHHITMLVEPGNTILHVLFDGIEHFSRCDFELCTRPLWDFANEIVSVRRNAFGCRSAKVTDRVGNIVPWRDLALLGRLHVFKEEIYTVGRGVFLTYFFHKELLLVVRE